MIYSKNFIYKILKKITLGLIVTYSSLSAHSLWVNSFESKLGHGQRHSMVSIGWGHEIPMGDKLNSINGRVFIESFSFYDPSLKKFELYKPEFKPAKPTLDNKEFNIYKTDLAMQKIEFKDKAKKGVHQLEIKTKPTYYTMYIDSKNKQRLKLKPIDQLKDVKKVIASFKYQGFAKSYLTVKKWEQPKALGHDLEIIPLSDLSNVKVGDLLEFKVSFKGKPVSHSPKGEKYATFWSSTYGQDDGVRLFSYIKNGKTSFRVPSNGQWIINTYNIQNVTKDNEIKNLYGKTKTLANAATITFHVK